MNEPDPAHIWFSDAASAPSASSGTATPVIGHQLVWGDRVIVERADTSVVTFVVRRTIHAPKDHFPTKEVHGRTAKERTRPGHQRDPTVALMPRGHGRTAGSAVDRRHVTQPAPSHVIAATAAPAAP